MSRLPPDAAIRTLPDPADFPSYRSGTDWVMVDTRRDLGAWGESVAAAALQRWGMEILERNRQHGRGEIDLIGQVGRRRVLVEVRTLRGAVDFERAFPLAKRRQLRALAGATGITRLDLVAVAVGAHGLEIHWLRDVGAD